MIDAQTFISSLPAEARVRVRIAGKELPSLAASGDFKWSGVVTGTQSQSSKDNFGRTMSEDMTLTVPLSSVPGGVAPDDGKIEMAYSADKTFTMWRATGSRRRGASLFSFVLGPING